MRCRNSLLELEKVHDSVTSALLFEALKKVGIVKVLLNIIKVIYSENRCTVKEGLALSKVLASKGVQCL